MKLIEDAFRKQYQESIKNPAKTLDGHIANENNVANDYRGRVLYEFFQNAVDRAESNIWVYMDLAARTLSIANDGKPFSIEKDTDRKYSDFESLCSINTSSKNQNESIGNKGVGFKSCWEYTKRATVVSKHKGFPWGFELKNPFVFMDIEQIDFENILEIKTWLEDESIKAVINKDEKGKVPSFYFPRRLPDSEVESFFSKYPEAQTIITLHDIETTKCDDLIARIDDFSRHEIFFVKQLATLQDKDLTLHIQVDDQDRVEIKTECNENEW
ncbi:MAG: sacsin N-terminal ATP-binding-like domain-containing protein, partial [Mariprofundaceae bacterium]